ncbi:MAG: GAF domain-containing SpoIIE family protein phosphatase [Planctomycetota bacterium]
MADDIQKKLNDLGAVLDIARAMMAEKDFRALMDLIVRETTKVMGADRSSLYMIDEKSHELYTWIGEGLKGKQIRVPVGQGIAGHVAATRKSLNVEDAYQCPHFNPEPDKQTGYRTRSVLCLPLFTHEGKIVGVLQVMNKREGRFGDYDESLLTALGSLAAVALDNDQLVQHYLEKKQIQHSLQIAKQIQQNLLPEADPHVNGFDIAGWTLSCDETGGDYYDFIPMDDGSLGVAIGDVSSHGVGPALLMTTARAFLRALIAGGVPIAAILGQLNDFLVDDMGEGRFMTLFYGVLDPNKKEMKFTSAGHEPGVVMRSGSGEFCEVENTGCPLGIMPGAPFPEGEVISLSSGDILLLLTDGILEAMDLKREKFGRERLRKVVAQEKTRPAREIIQSVHKAVLDFCAGAAQRDDLTMVVIKTE